jgi:hypothetical protein
MTKLKMSDSGIYHCGIAVNTRIIYLRSIHLVVSKGELPLPCGSRPSWVARLQSWRGLKKQLPLVETFSTCGSRALQGSHIRYLHYDS